MFHVPSLKWKSRPKYSIEYFGKLTSTRVFSVETDKELGPSTYNPAQDYGQPIYLSSAVHWEWRSWGTQHSNPRKLVFQFKRSAVYEPNPYVEFRVKLSSPGVTRRAVKQAEI